MPRMKFRRLTAVLLPAAVLFAAGAGPAQAANPRPPALRLLTASPTGTAPGDATIKLRFSAPLAPLTAKSEPRLSPSTPGAWSQPSPRTLTFTPQGAFLPGIGVHIIVPKGLAATNG